jgi:hypothetical protein
MVMLTHKYGMPVLEFTVAEINEMIPIRGGHFSNLVFDDGQYRIWVSRMTKADGAPFDDAIEVEGFCPVNYPAPYFMGTPARLGCWLPYKDYDPRYTEKIRLVSLRDF